MDLQFIITTAASLVAILALVGLAAWAKIARPAADLDEAVALRVLADEFPDHELGRVWIAADHKAAVTRSGDEALIVYRIGDGYVARSMPWTRLADSQAGMGGVTLKIGDITAPRARFALAESAVWPPVETAL